MQNPVRLSLGKVSEEERKITLKRRSLKKQRNNSLNYEEDPLKIVEQGKYNRRTED